MTPAEVIDLLTVAAAYDRRTVGEADVEAWSDAATREKWTFAEAQEAVKSHYASSAQFLMPGHVTERISRGRRPIGQPPKYVGLTPEQQEFEQLNRARMVGLIGPAFSMPTDQPQQPVRDDAAREAARRELNAIRHEPRPREESA